METGAPSRLVVAAGPASATASGWRTIERVARVVSATILIGALCGAAIGGLGGRLAIRVLFLTSDDAVRGVTSDDGFEIGRFSLSSTFGLVIVTAALGVLAALVYLAAQPFLRPLGGWAVAAAALLYGSIGGALLVHQGGVDFTFLEPVALAIALFVALCSAFGAAVAALVGPAARPSAWPQRLPRWAILPPLLVLVLPPFLLVAALAAVLVWAADATDPADGAWRALQACAWAVMGGLVVFGVVDLARDAVALT